jgi:flagellar biosynthetic protein FlhB
MEMMRRGLSQGEVYLNAGELMQVVREVALQSLIAIVPILAVMLLVAIVGHLIQFGPMLSTQTLEPKFDRLNPVQGLQNLYGRKNMVRSGLNIVKLLIVCCVGYAYLSRCVAEIAMLPVLELKGMLAVAGELMLHLVMWLLALLLVLGVADFMFQKWQHTQELKMTKQEVQDERRSMDGDPQIKGRRLRMMRQIAMQQVNNAVPNANVVVTNPTHFSVALQYDQGSMAAPRVVAKGVDHMALRIRQVAMIHKVPIVERPPLARALYAEVEVGQEINEELYQAVAEVLAYVYRLEKEAA